MRLPYEDVNPYAFEMPVSPHLASAGVIIDIDLLNKKFTELKQHADIVVVEGAGGWLSPLSVDLNNEGLVKALKLPVILVVGMKLGCLNHALLTRRAVEIAAVDCAGWVAVQLDAEMPFFDENVNYLKNHLNAPFFGVLPHFEQADFEQLSYYFSGNLRIN